MSNEINAVREYLQDTLGFSAALRANYSWHKQRRIFVATKTLTWQIFLRVKKLQSLTVSRLCSFLNLEKL